MTQEARRQAAQAYGQRILEQYEKTHGTATAAALDVIAMLEELEVLYLEAAGDLAASGLREPYNVTRYNKGTRENKAFGPLIKIQTQKARLLRELRLLPGSRKGAEPEGEADVSDLDDY